MLSLFGLFVWSGSRPVRYLIVIMKQVFVHYTGTLKSDGKEFDSNLLGEPITFELGENKVIEGWEQGLLGTCPGESIKLEIPAKLGYGEKGWFTVTDIIILITFNNYQYYF